MKSISIVPFSFDDKEMLHQIQAELAQLFNYQIWINEKEIDSSPFFDEVRVQYNSTKILEYFLSVNSDPNEVIIGITSLDLFIPILTFVFGEAQLNGKAAVVSTKRLDPQYYGLPSDNKLHYERLLKEVIHEFGHVVGLLHCKNIDCVMRSSTYVEEIDLKNKEFCSECRKLVKCELG